MILHKCDHPWCVNPDHLYPGDAKQNAKDALTHGRMESGSRHRSKLLRNNPSLFKLTLKKAEEIRRRVSLGELQKALAIEYGVSRAQVCRIIAGMRWAS